MNQLVILLSCVLALAGPTSVFAEESVRILLVTGGCCHDYEHQTKMLKQAFEENEVKADWKVVLEGGTGTEAEIDLYEQADWAKGFDVVIHNECFANTKSEEYIRKITEAHKAGANAVVIHCAMHTYRAAQFDDWRQFLGVTSRRHDHQSEYPIKVVAPDHPITEGFPANWTTPKDELYIVETVWPGAVPLATANSERDGSSHPCFWINHYGEGRVFGSTFGHGNATFEDPVFQRAVVRGTLWAAGKLDESP